MSQANAITVSYRPDAGIGSNFVGVIDWYWYAKHTGTPIYVKWIENGNNFFNNLFVQKQQENDHSMLTTDYYAWSKLINPEITDLRYKDMPLYKKLNNCLTGNPKFYYDPDFRESITFLHNLYKNNLSVNPKILAELPQLDNTLGIHIRTIALYFTDPKFEIPLHTVMNEAEYYAKNLENIKRKFEAGRYDNIYLGCDDQLFVDICIKEFKDKLIFQNYYRNMYHNSINRYYAHSPNTGINERPPVSEEYYYALIDMLMFSSCKEFMGCVSGMTFMAMILNPNPNFELFDVMKQIAMTG